MKTFMKVVAASAVLVAMTASAGSWYYDEPVYQNAVEKYEECNKPSSFSGGPVCTPPPTCEEYVDRSPFSGWPSCEPDKPTQPHVYCGAYSVTTGYFTSRDVAITEDGEITKVVDRVLFQVEPGLKFQLLEYIDEDGKHIVD